MILILEMQSTPLFPAVSKNAKYFFHPAAEPVTLSRPEVSPLFCHFMFRSAQAVCPPPPSLPSSSRPPLLLLILRVCVL